MTRLNTRQQIIDAGLKTLLEKGFNGAGVQDITTLAGVPKGSFYNHFDSKEALGAEIVQCYGQASSARRAVLRDTSIPPLERLRRHYAATTEAFAASHYERGCLLGNFSAELSDQSPLIRDSLRDVFVQWTQDLEAAIKDAQDQGAIANKTDPADLAAFVLDAFEGALLRARVEKTGRPLERFTQLIFTQILV